MHKLYGGMGLKDLRTQGIALASKWILQAIDGEEPWKVLIRNNISSSTPKKAKKWKGLPIIDLLLGQMDVAPAGSRVFKSLWKAWEQVKHLVQYNMKGCKQGQFTSDRSIWWNLSYHGKPLAALQGCSALKWNNMGIRHFAQILENGKLRTWEDLQLALAIPVSQHRTYNMLRSTLSNALPQPLLSHSPFSSSAIS